MSRDKELKIDLKWLESKDFEQFVLGDSPNEKLYFTDEVMDALSEEFEIPSEHRQAIQDLFEVGAISYHREKEWKGTDFPACREELTSLSESATELNQKLTQISDDALRILLASGLGRTAGGHPYPKIEEQPLDDSQAAVATLLFRRDSDRSVHKFSITSISEILSSLSETAQLALIAAGQGRSGRKGNLHVLDIVHFAYQAWVSILERQFKLYWLNGHEPLTTSADFCVRVATFADPSVDIRSVATCANKIQNKGISIKDLLKSPEEIWDFCERIE